MEPLPNEIGDFRGPGSSSSNECPNDSGSKKYAEWKPAERRTFIAACETAIAEGHRHGESFMKSGWERVITLFNSISGHNWSKQQLCNHWDAMRRDHKRLTELLSCTGVEYNPSTGRIVALDEWWTRKIKENKEYKDFKDKDVSEIYVRYHQLFGNSYDGDKYAMTPTMLCRTGLALFEDSDFIPVDGESTGSSDEGDEERCNSSVNTAKARNGGKRKLSMTSKKGKKKKKKISTRELLFSVNRANSAAEKVAAKLNTFMAPKENAGVECVKELLAAGRLKRRTPLYFFACTILTQKRYWDMLSVMCDVDEKFEWIEWQFNEEKK